VLGQRAANAEPLRMLVVLHRPPFQDRDEPVHHGVNVGRGISPVALHTIVSDVADRDGVSR